MRTLTRKQRSEIVRDLKNDRENFNYSLEEADPENIRQTWEVLGVYKASFVALLPSQDAVQRLSAFGIYYVESIHLLRRAWIETLCSYYGVGHALLRAALESLIRGAFWEGMAHTQFRGAAEVVRRGKSLTIEGRKKTLLDWFTDVFEHAPNAEKEMETISAAVFDRTSALFSNRVLVRVVPEFKRMIEQLSAWELLSPVEEPVAAIYENLYWGLSSEAHLIPDKTLMGRRFVAGKSAVPVIDFNSEELDSFANALVCIVDIGIVLSLNLVNKILSSDEALQKRLAVLSFNIRTTLPGLYSARLCERFMRAT